MEITRVNLVYFSPTQTTRKTLRTMASAFSVEVKEYDITLNREIEVPVFGADELVIAGVPVYGGRVPLLVESFFQGLKADHTPAAVVGVYGNRHYDDAVLELADYLQAGGFAVCAGAACVGEHSFGNEVATGRPDADDLAKAKEFGEALRSKLEAAEDAGQLTAPEIPGNRPYKARGTAPNTAAPKTTDACVKCGICVKNCPVGIIDPADPTHITDVSKCQRCFSCVKKCPKQAKYFDAEGVLKGMAMLKANCSARREPEFYL